MADPPKPAEQLTRDELLAMWDPEVDTAQVVAWTESLALAVAGVDRLALREEQEVLVRAAVAADRLPAGAREALLAAGWKL